ncbi:hypothetical protein FRC08_004741 [Ceratobasidium sp. 394]|nr:hypothetical protein FRC08_004741 [Ceratobasidium sp. 394]
MLPRRSHFEYPYICTNPRCQQVFRSTGHWRIHAKANRFGCSKFNVVLRVHQNLRRDTDATEAAETTTEPEPDYLDAVVDDLDTITDDSYGVLGNSHWESPLQAPNSHPTPPYPSTNSAYNLHPTSDTNFVVSPVDLDFFRMMNPWADNDILATEESGEADQLNFNVTYAQAQETDTPNIQRTNNPVAEADTRSLPYTRILSNGRVIYRHPTAGRTFGKAETPWEAQRRKNQEEHGGNRWGIWRTRDEWESAKWMATTRVSQSSIDKLLKTARYKDVGYGFHTAKTLFKTVEDEMEGFGGPDWHAVDVTLAGTDKSDKATLFYRDIEACVDFLFGRPTFAGKMAFSPERLFDTDDETRLYENPWTAEYWNKRQETLPIGTTLGGLIFASNSTQLSTHSGDVAAHAVYMTLANLDKSTRASTSENGWILVAYIPKDKFHRTITKMEDRPEAVRQRVANMLNRRLFHRSMEIITRPLLCEKPHETVDPEGNIRSVLYQLLGYVADLEEQHLVSCTGAMSCPHCECDGIDIGKAECSPPRTPAEVLEQIKKIKDDYREAYNRPVSLEEFLNLATKEHMNGVDEPFWAYLPNVNIFEALSPDILHGYHKFFFDHIHKWDLTGVGKDEYNARIKSQVHLAHDRAFPNGILHISQMTGIEHRTLARSHLCIVADSPNKITRKSVAATRAAMDVVYLSQLPIHTERSLADYRQAYTDLMEYRWAWVQNGTRKGKKKVINHFHIPKMHVMRHLEDHIRLKGSADNFSTETMEHLHSDVKEAYRASNRREWKQQTVRWLTRREKMRDFEAWMKWCDAERRKNGEIVELEEDDVEDNASESGSESKSESELDVKSESESKIGDLGEADEGEFEFFPGRHEEQVFDEFEDNNWDESEEQEENEYKGQEQEEGDDWWTHDEDSVPSAGMHDYIMNYLQGVTQSQQDVEGQQRGQKRAYASVGGEESGGSIDPRSQPRPRLQGVHFLSELQKVNKHPTLRRKALQDISQIFNLGLPQFLRAVKKNSYLASLPITIDEYIPVNTWDAIRAHLYSHTTNPKAEMQRMRAKPAREHLAAQYDPVWYTTDSGIDPSIVRLQGV